MRKNSEKSGLGVTDLCHELSSSPYKTLVTLPLHLINDQKIFYPLRPNFSKRVILHRETTAGPARSGRDG